MLNLNASAPPGSKEKRELISHTNRERIIDLESQINVFLSGGIAEDFIFQLENFLSHFLM